MGKRKRAIANRPYKTIALYKGVKLENESRDASALYFVFVRVIRSKKN